MVEPAPLIETPLAKAPPGGGASWFSGAGGARLRAAVFNPPGRARGSIVLSPGRTEVIEKYYEFIGDLLERGFVVLVHDWRGQGLSHHDLPDRLKGHANGFKPFLDDYRALLNTYQSQLPKPWVAVGHSMGGCLTLLAMAQGETRFASAILSAPMLGMQTGKVKISTARRLAALNVMLGRGRLYVQNQPGKPFDDTFEGNLLTHDRARFDRGCSLIAAEPKLALGAPTWGWLDFAFRATNWLAQPDRLRAVTAPVVIVAAEHDKLVDNAAQAAAARNLPQGQFVTVPGAFHEILMETDPMRNFFQRTLDSLTGRTAPKPAEAPAPVAATPPKPTEAPAPAPVIAAAPKPAPVATAPVKKALAKKPVAAAKPVAAKVKAPVAKVAQKLAVKAAAKPAAKTIAKPAVVKAPVAKTPPAKAAAKPATKAASVKAVKPGVMPATAKIGLKVAPRTPAVKKPVAKKPAPTAA